MKTPKVSKLLQAAVDHVDGLHDHRTAAWIIAELVGQQGARFWHSGGTYLLRCRGVQASCTWSKDDGLLNAWRTLANRKLADAATPGIGQPSPATYASETNKDRNAKEETPA